jgi:hypothetical protein
MAFIHSMIVAPAAWLRDSKLGFASAGTCIAVA